ncbi:MAG: PadR family transcriptional regulator [Gemmatimonadetes bacterium]|nr:PadR family transcriptional regulator [Gemmatimonadota bacterium]
MDLLKGTLDVLVLRSLAAGPRHGYAVARWIRTASRDVLVVEDRALYLALHRLEARGDVGSEWGTSENGRRARYYRLTRSGRRRLGAEEAKWTKYADAVFRVLRADPEEMP